MVKFAAVLTFIRRTSRTYNYNFLLNNKEWAIDPKAELNVDDGYGNKNSVIYISNNVLPAFYKRSKTKLKKGLK